MEDKKVIKPAAKKAGMHVRSKKKTAVARAVIKKGSGKVKINKMGLDCYAQGHVLSMIKEPLMIASEVIPEYDILVNVTGSGAMSRANAVRSVIAKALVKAKGKKYKDLFLQYDRTLLVDDVRKVESKKPLGRKARGKKQQSKR
ncbi:MAG: 30S ribosomal protein S9 [Candidatus ainarchaeum sp.]|nr:30S ribosomal protein S9 [Candidatus ainarchaeum sp.]